MRARLACLLLLLSCLVPSAHSEIMVIVHADSPLKSLTSKEVSDLYLGRLRTVGGAPVQVLDLSGDTPLRERFFKSLNGMDLRRVNAYWARLQFSGDMLAPFQLGNSDRMLEAVSHNKLAIGYIDSQLVSPRVRSVLSLND
jgi:ABC-type phosphate transport system substrate-binding protein